MKIWNTPSQHIGWWRILASVDFLVTVYFLCHLTHLIQSRSWYYVQYVLLMSTKIRHMAMLTNTIGEFFVGDVSFLLASEVTRHS